MNMLCSKRRYITSIYRSSKITTISRLDSIRLSNSIFSACLPKRWKKSDNKENGNKNSIKGEIHTTLKAMYKNIVLMADEETATLAPHDDNHDE
jgi:hypothetical protein